MYSTPYLWLISPISPMQCFYRLESNFLCQPELVYTVLKASTLGVHVQRQWQRVPWQ